MALTDTFVKNVKSGTATAGKKHTDGQGLYLHVKEAGKYWRMNYRFAGKQKTLALGVYPAVSLAKARQRRDKARELLADGIDPSTAKQEDKQAKADAAANTFEAVARDWLIKTKAKRAAITHLKVATWLEKDAFPLSAICLSPPLGRVTCSIRLFARWRRAALSTRPTGSSSSAGRCSTMPS